MQFSSLEKFLHFKQAGQLKSIIAYSSCVAIKAQLATSNEIEPLLQFIHGLEIPMKHLVIEVPIIQNYTVLQDQIMNYNARIYQDGRTIFRVTPYF